MRLGRLEVYPRRRPRRLAAVAACATVLVVAAPAQARSGYQPWWCGVVHGATR